MYKSWSHKLFFKINSYVGKSKALDTFMIFCAHWLAWGMVLVFIIWGIINSTLFISTTFFLLAGICSYLVSYLIALIFKHERPKKEFPKAKVLIKTLGSWKSFPSDHTIGVTLILFAAWYTGMELSLFFLLSVWAFAVMVGRVFVGVHYPRDIVGGLAVASFFGYIFLAILR